MLIPRARTRGPRQDTGLASYIVEKTIASRNPTKV